ncbi:hypothetical protein PMIN01_02566 [Paraphaeosphaeria minitans]|uniref:Uncharacterized protein n=1 Tax=Paraphaeosphaeria minitans TaxID=565426 RepID=A0A9P6KVD4_9PLEO|nr:hypothetical protein PMIN01_02566 [Paraphaeosphaeria minitans]
MVTVRINVGVNVCVNVCVNVWERLLTGESTRRLTPSSLAFDPLSTPSITLLDMLQDLRRPSCLDPGGEEMRAHNNTVAIGHGDCAMSSHKNEWGSRGVQETKFRRRHLLRSSLTGGSIR